MILVINFFNKVASEIDKKYFPTLTYYRDNKDCTNVHYSLELFSNGCLTYDKLITKLSKACKDTEANIKLIVDKYIQ